MKKERRTPRHFDDQFRLSVLKDYYESGASYSQISRKYDVSSGNVIAWERKYMNKCVPLPQIFKNWKNRYLWQRNQRKQEFHRSRVKKIS